MGILVAVPCHLFLIIIINHRHHRHHIIVSNTRVRATKEHAVAWSF
jgi:hypothetical protein